MRLTGTGRRSYLVFGSKSAVRDVRGEVGVVDGTEGEPIGPAAAEVGDIDVLRRGKTGEIMFSYCRLSLLAEQRETLEALEFTRACRQKKRGREGLIFHVTLQSAH